MNMIEPARPETEPKQTIVEMVRQVAKLHPDREAVVCGERRQSWAEFDARVNRVANMLIGLGVERGDRVAALAPNSGEYAEIFMGTLRAGACIVPLSTMASTPALEKMITDCGAKVFFLAEDYRGLADPFAERLQLVPGGRIAIDFAAPGWAGYEDTLGDDTDPMVEVGFEDPFNIIYSSGTTGTPKGILHNHWMRAVQMERVEANGYANNARTLLSTPLYSNTTIVAFLPTLVGGSTVHLMRKFDAREYLGLVEAEKITHTMLVPVQYKRIMDVPDFGTFDLSSMLLKLSTSAPLRADVKRDVLDRFPGQLVEYYGLTEGGGVTILNATENPGKLDTVGEPGPGVVLKFIDEDGNEVPKGQIGEICGRSSAMMAGYFGRKELTQDYLWHDADGVAYFRSGDMGAMDEDGFVRLTDRKKDMIISGGLNIYANDLELVLLGDPDVTDAAVIGVPSEAWGETPLGLVVLRAGAKRGAEEILERANTTLGKSQRLSAIEIRSELPRSSIGKILKKDLRAEILAR